MARPWLKVEPALVFHPKTARLADALGVSTQHAVGVLIELWGYFLEFQGDGDVLACPADVLRRVLGTSAADPLEMLQKCGLVDADGRLHDWDEYAGAIIETRRKEAARKRLERKTRRQDVRRTSAGRTRDVRGQSRVESRVDTTRAAAAAAAGLTELPTVAKFSPVTAEALEILNGNLGAEHLAAIDSFVRASQHPDATLAAIRALGPGGIDEQVGVGWHDIGQAIFELRAVSGEFSPARLRGFIRNLKQPDRPPRPPEGPRYADGPRSAPQPTKLYLTADELDVRAGIPLVPRVAP